MLLPESGRRRMVAMILGTALLAGCAGTPDSEDSRAAEAYILVVDWVLADPGLAPDPAPDKLPLIFVESLGPGEIDLGVQVEIVGHFEEEADIRFIDERGEALDEADGAPVRDGGLLLGLGAVPLTGPLEIRGEAYRSVNRVVGYRFRIDGSGQMPVLITPPESVEPEGLVARP